MFVNKKARKVILSFDDEIKGFFKELKEFVLEITNDPKCDPKFPITNLGYFSMRFSGEDGVVHNNKGRIIIEFPIDKFLVFFNLPVQLYLSRNKNFRELLNYNQEDLFLLRFEFFNGTNYDMKISIFRDGLFNDVKVNFLSIENNYEDLGFTNIVISDLLKKYGLF